PTVAVPQPMPAVVARPEELAKARSVLQEAPALRPWRNTSTLMFVLPFVPNTNGCANGKRANCEVGRFAGIAGTFTLWRGRATTMSEPTLFANVELSAPGTFAVLDIWISMSTVNAARSLVLAVGRKP